MSTRFRIATTVAVLLVVLGGLGFAGRLLGVPEAARFASPDSGAGPRVQHVLAQLVLREEGLSRQRAPLVLIAADVNAFLARDVRIRDLPVGPLAVRLGDGALEVAGRTSPRRLLGEGAPGWPSAVLPAALLDLDLWLVARGQLTVEEGAGRLLVTGAAVGRQPIPTGWLWRLLGVEPAKLVLWRMPRVVNRLEVLPGRLVVHTRGG